MPYTSPANSKIPDGAQRVFKGVIFDIYQWQQELFDGSFATYEMAARRDGAVVFPVLPDGRILLVKDTQPVQGTVITAPAGGVEEGEAPEQAARRELLEETGYVAEELTPLFSVSPSKKVAWTIHLFVGKGVKKISEPALDAGERIELYPVSFDEMVRLATEESENFQNKEFTFLAFLARLDPSKMETLRKTFAP